MRWALALLAAVALTTGVVAAYADRAVFNSDGFADRTEAALRSGTVSTTVARRLSDAAIGARPDLVAVRPLVQSVAEGVVRSSAFRSLVRGAARDAHRSVFDGDATTVTLTVADTGVLLAEALRHLRPDLARSIPAGLPVRFSAAASDAETAAVRAAALAERVRVIAVVGLVGFALLAAIAFALWRRAALIPLGVAVAGAAGVTALAAVLAPRVVTDDAALRVVLETWLDPLAAWCGVVAGFGTVIALAAASILRPVELLPWLWGREPAASRVAGHPPAWLVRTPVWLRAVATIAVGAVLVLEPEAVLRLAVMAAGLLLVIAGASELLRLAARPQPVRLPRIGRGIRVAVLSLLLVGGLVAAGRAAGDDPEPVRVGRCNGKAELCDRRLDQVAFVGTHNSMAADGEPGWLFVAQDAGIQAQLADGVRSLLIDTHYGFATPRGVATDLTGDSKSRAKVEGEVGSRFVETAQRLRSRIGFTGNEPREIFLCHAFCEVGATRALEALEGVHRFLVAHPEEVLILSIEDDTKAADTAKLIRDSGLIREVYRGPAKPPWPTLREMIERNERVLVLIEEDPGDEPWMHRQDEVAQETPFHFGTPAELAAPGSCRPNRGGTAGSLLLVNHWVDTSPAPRQSIAQEVNARGFLGPRLARCRSERGLVGNIVAVDFYRQGDVFATVGAEG